MKLAVEGLSRSITITAISDAQLEPGHEDSADSRNEVRAAAPRAWGWQLGAASAPARSLDAGGVPCARRPTAHRMPAQAWHCMAQEARYFVKEFQAGREFSPEWLMWQDNMAHEKEYAACMATGAGRAAGRGRWEARAPGLSKHSRPWPSWAGGAGSLQHRCPHCSQPAERLPGRDGAAPACPAPAEPLLLGEPVEVPQHIARAFFGFPREQQVGGAARGASWGGGLQLVGPAAHRRCGLPRVLRPCAADRPTRAAAARAPLPPCRSSWPGRRTASSWAGCCACSTAGTAGVSGAVSCALSTQWLQNDACSLRRSPVGGSQGRARACDHARRRPPTPLAPRNRPPAAYATFPRNLTEDLYGGLRGQWLVMTCRGGTVTTFALRRFKAGSLVSGARREAGAQMR